MLTTTNIKDEVFALLKRLDKTRTENGAKKVIKKINPLVLPILKRFYELELLYDSNFFNTEPLDRSVIKSFLKNTSGTVKDYFYNEELNALEVDVHDVCWGEEQTETHYLPLIALEDMDTIEQTLKFNQSKKLHSLINHKSFLLQADINTWNGEKNTIEYYKLYDVLYLDPGDDKYKIVQAWPAYSEKGHIIWTMNDDNTTILANTRIGLKIKHYEKKEVV